MLNTDASEEIAINEPKYFISTGYYAENNDLYQWAQDKQKLTGLVSNLSEAWDELEFQGIAEYWRPLDFEKQEVMTEGKLRRHYANQIKTYDYYKYANEDVYPLEEVEFFDEGVHLSERRQFRLIADTLSDIQTKKLLDRECNYLLRPFDLHVIKRELGLKESRYSDLILNLRYLKHSISYEVFNIGDHFYGSIGTQADMWQDPGIQACFIGISNYCSGAFHEPTTCRPGGGALGHIRTYHVGNLFTFANYRFAIGDVAYNGAASAINSGQDIIFSSDKIREQSEKLGDALRYQNFREKLKDKNRVYTR